MRIHLARHTSNPVVAVCGVILILLALSPNSGQAANLQDLQRNITKEVNRSRGLTRAILTKLKNIDTSCRRADGRPLPGQVIAGRQLLGQAQALRTSFATTAKNAGNLITEFTRRYRVIKNPGAREIKARAAVDRLTEDLQRHKEYVQKFFGLAERDFGLPIKPPAGRSAAGEVPVPAAPGLFMKGELSGVLGGSSYRRPNADPATDLSSSNLGLRIAGALTPNTRTQIPFQLSHEKKIEQKKIESTKLGTGIRHALHKNVDLNFNLGYHRFTDKDEKTLNFGDFSFGGGSAFHTKHLRLKMKVRRLSRSYGDNEPADYNTLSLQPDLALRVGNGWTTFGVKSFRKSNEVEALDHREFAPFFRWEFTQGGSELNVRYQQLSHPNVANSTRDNNRLKANFLLKHKNNSGQTTFGPEIAVYRYPNAKQNDYLDAGFVFNGRSFGRKSAMNSLRLVYRKYEDTLRFDFAQLTLRRNKQAAGSGFGWEMNLAGRYYTESSDNDDPPQSANGHSPHTVDYYQRLSWTITGTGGFREFTLGPIFGGKFIMDTDRNDASENEVDYVWANPRNTALGGAHAKMRLTAASTFRLEARFQWRTDFLYNAEPARRLTTTDLNLTVNYQIHPRLMLGFKAKLHTTRADLESETDLEKSTITARIRYLFDVVR